MDDMTWRKRTIDAVVIIRSMYKNFECNPFDKARYRAKLKDLEQFIKDNPPMAQPLDAVSFISNGTIKSPPIEEFNIWLVRRDNGLRVAAASNEFFARKLAKAMTDSFSPNKYMLETDYIAQLAKGKM